jgi:hypothetical protein
MLRYEPMLVVLQPGGYRENYLTVPKGSDMAPRYRLGVNLCSDGRSIQGEGGDNWRG